MTTVRIEDCRALKYCTLGVRRFFDKHGLDFKTFVSEGIPSERMPQDDIQVQRLIEQAKRREGGSNG